MNLKKLLSSTLLFLATCGVLLASGTPKVEQFRLPAGITADDYMAGTIVIKLKPEYRAQSRINGIELDALNTAFSAAGVSQVNKMFPGHQPPAQTRNAQGLPMVDLSLIYIVNYSSGQPIEKVINSILRTGLVEFAEPKYLPKLTFTPNDPNLGLQYFLGKIQAYAAWDIAQGDTNVVIGITDTGTDLDHPDLEPNLKYNYNDPVDGIDNDNDGYIDNWRGWDLGENDNNPSVGASNHGSHVSGCAAAATHNGTGVASPGFRCKYLPVKIANASGSLTMAYEGIVYAADQGCHIINCSWGGGGGGSLGQTIIDYATINKNALVIASAGNDNNELPFYPASYRYVLSVASTTNSDAKSSFSNYGANIDVCAPGSNIYTAMSNNTYGYMSGTSMAGPVCAGAAAVVKAHFPSYNALQVGERIRVTCDNIYTVPSNGAYLNKLGKGRINMFRALTENSPAVRMTNIILTDNNDNAFVVGDTVRITGDITNYLDPTSNLDIVISTSSPWVTIVDNNHFVGALGTLATVDNNNDPFLIRVNAGAPQNHKVTVKIDFTDGIYTDFQIIDMVVNVDYINVTINQVYTTITSKGRICYNGENQTEGLGFTYNGENLVYEAGLMIGQSNSKVSDNVRGATGTDNDFVSTQVVQRLIPSVQSDFDLFGKFNDNAASTPVPVLVSHKSLSWNNPGDDKYHIVEYVIKNTGTSSLSNVWSGIFADWDIQDYNLNKANENAALKMGYVYNTTATGLWAGIKVLTPTPFNHYAIDNISGGSGGVNMFDGYDTGEKYTTLSTARALAGVAGGGNDVIDVVSTGPFTIPAGDSIKVAFALIAGDSLSDLNNSAVNAQIKYDGLTSSLPGLETNTGELSIYPNPASHMVFISGNLKAGPVEVIDITGRVVLKPELTSAGSQLHSFPVHQLAPGSYLVRITSGSGENLFRLVVR
jgi:serine protease